MEKKCPQCYNKKKCIEHASVKITKRIGPKQACPLHKERKKRCQGIRICPLWNKKGKHAAKPKSSSQDNDAKESPSRPRSLTVSEFLEENEQYWHKNFSQDPLLASAPSQDTPLESRRVAPEMQSSQASQCPHLKTLL